MLPSQNIILTEVDVLKISNMEREIKDLKYLK